MPCPTKFTWKLEDISASDAGRTEDTVMQKNTIGHAVGLELVWNYKTDRETARILQAFYKEYIRVDYRDPLIGEFVTLEFYRGNATVPMYNSKLGLWENIAFNLISRSGKEYEERLAEFNIALP